MIRALALLELHVSETKTASHQVGSDLIQYICADKAQKFPECNQHDINRDPTRSCPFN